MIRMTPRPDPDERISKMIFASIYPLYVNKVEKKGRTEADLRRVLQWLTGFTKARLDGHIKRGSTFEALFEDAELRSTIVVEDLVRWAGGWRMVDSCLCQGSR